MRQLALIALAILTTGQTAQAETCVPQKLDDGRYVLVTHWPQPIDGAGVADRVCFFRPGVTESDLCRTDPIPTTDDGSRFEFAGQAFAIGSVCGGGDIGSSVTQVAAYAVALPAGQTWTWQAYAENATGRGAVSTESFVIPRAVEPEVPLPGQPQLLSALRTFIDEVLRFQRESIAATRDQAAALREFRRALIRAERRRRQLASR